MMKQSRFGSLYIHNLGINWKIFVNFSDINKHMLKYTKDKEFYKCEREPTQDQIKDFYQKTLSIKAKIE